MSSEVAVNRTPGSGALVLPLYALTLFLSAFLLFSVQPMFTKRVLPLLGGSAAVWNTAVVFFQGTLLLGYAYAHFSTRYLGPKAQTLLHGAVLVLGFLALPIGVAAWTPPTGEMPIPWMIGLLTVSIGLPFFAISATAPLLQKWFAHTDHAASGDPYFLYGGSNLGSLVALLAYPLLIERLLGLGAQGTAWTVGYVLLFLLIATCGVVLVRRYKLAPEGQAVEEQGLVRDVTWKLRARWLALSVVPSALLLGVTLHLATDVASMPFLWVLPLALYLLTFVLVFARRPWFSQKWLLRAQVLFVGSAAVLYQLPILFVLLALHVGAMFFTSMVCHGELARLRPRATHLTEFYLWMSIGGVVGGFLSAIVAPVVFDGVYEYPIALLVGLLLRPRPADAAQRARFPALARALDLALPLALLYVLRENWLGLLAAKLVPVASLEDHATIFAQGLLSRLLVVAVLFSFATRPARLALGALAALLILTPDVFGSHALLRKEAAQNLGTRLFRERSFFGVYTVDEFEVPGIGRFHILQNGTTLHGGQNLDRPLGPVTYYVREGPVGQFFDILKSSGRPVQRIGVIGLGVGVLACYLSPGQTMRFYEIDPLDERIARDAGLFTYLEDAGKRVDVVLGDGRLSLAAEPDESFDVLVVDAFSSDAIPAHLLTREAFALYFQKLSEHGLLFLHISNSFIDLMPIAANLVADAGLAGRYCQKFTPTFTFSAEASEWVVVARSKDRIARFGNIATPWPELAPDPRFGTWTDDSNSILEVVKWSGSERSPRHARDE